MERPSGDECVAAESTVDVEPLASRSCELGDVSFVAVLETADRTRVGWATPDGLEVVGIGESARFTAEGPDRFRAVGAQSEPVFDALTHHGPEHARPRAFGGAAFHDRSGGTTGVRTGQRGRDGRVDGLWTGFDGAAFVVPEVQVVRTDDGSWLTVVGPEDADVSSRLDGWRERIDALPTMRSAGTAPGIIGLDRTTDRQEWIDQVSGILDRIATGDLEKVVLAQALTAHLEEPLDVPATLERLRRRYPDCYRFTIGHGTDRTFFGAPPERLAAKRGDRLETEALAGSMPRGETTEVDDDHLDRLFESDRLEREHGIVVDAITGQLAPLAREVTVDERTVRRLATIQHLLTPISATLDPDRHVLEIVDALHPTPAVGGVPQRAACETIESVERFDRGWYAAPVGWFDGEGDGEFAVGIRAGVAADRSVTLFGGNGIVADSDPDEEWEEVQLKLQPILDELRRVR